MNCFHSSMNKFWIFTTQQDRKKTATHSERTESTNLLIKPLIKIQGGGTGKFEDGSSSDILSDYGSSSSSGSQGSI